MSLNVRCGIKDGPLALRHDGFVKDGYTVDLRAAIIGVKISGRTPPLGRWKIKRGDYGDLNGSIFWPTAGRQKRPIGSFFLGGVPAVVKAVQNQNPQPKDEPTQEGGNVDPDHQQAGNPFIAGVKGAKQGTPTTSPDRAGVGVLNQDPGNNDAGRATDTQATPNSDADLIVLPIRDRKWKEDDRYGDLPAYAPKQGEKPMQLKLGQRGILFAGTEENNFEPLFVPIDMGQLIAANAAGPATMGTMVYDLKAPGEIDEEVGARLQSIFRVVKNPPWRGSDGKSVNGPNVIALNLGSPMTGQQDSDAGAIYYQDTAGLDTFCGWLSQARGGPFSVRPATNEKHSHGDPMNDSCISESAHLSTFSLFRDGSVIDGEGTADEDAVGGKTPSGQLQPIDESEHDGPLFFERRFPADVKKAPHRVFVHLEFDPGAGKLPNRSQTNDTRSHAGIWRWWAESFLYEPPNTPTGGPPSVPPPTDGPPGIPEQPDNPFLKRPPNIPGQPELPENFVERVGRITARGIGAAASSGIGGAALNPLGVGDAIRSGIGGSQKPPAVPPPPPPGEPEEKDPLEELSSRLGSNGSWYGSTAQLVRDRPWDEPRRFSASSNEVSFPAVNFRAQLFRTGAPWMTNWMSPNADALSWFDQYAPVVARMEAYGAQGGDPGDDILNGSPSGARAGNPFDYTTQRATGSPYGGGTADGSVAFLPAEVTMADIDKDDLQPSTAPLSTAFMVFPSVSRLAFGRPDLTSGGITNGHTLQTNADGDLVATSIDAAGATIESWNIVRPTMQALFGQTADAGPFANTAAENSLLGTGEGTLTIPANGWREGMSIRNLTRGHMNTKAAAVGTGQVRGYVGSSNVLDSGAVAIPAGLASSNQRPWECEFILTCRDLSTPSAAVFSGTIIFKTSSAAGTTFTIGDATWSGTIDTTVAQDIDVTWTWGTADNANSITGTNGKQDSETP